MRIKVRAKPGAKKEEVKKLSETCYSVSVKERPLDNKANYAVRETLAGYFGIPKSRVILIRGEKSREKTFEINKI